MNSRIEYCFHSKKKCEYVTIDRTNVAINQLILKIKEQEKLADQDNVHLVLKNKQTGSIYKNEYDFINKNTSVVVYRVPETSKIYLEANPPQVAEAAQQPGQEPEEGQEQENQEPIEEPEEELNEDAKSKEELRKEQVNFFYKTPNVPRSFILRPTSGECVLPYNEISFFQRTDEPPFALKRWTIDDLKRWMCPLCNRIMTHATITPCCKVAYCDSCITSALLRSGSVCPNSDCNRDKILPSTLMPATQLREEIKDWQKYDPKKLKDTQEFEALNSKNKSEQHESSSRHINNFEKRDEFLNDRGSREDRRPRDDDSDDDDGRPKYSDRPRSRDDRRPRDDDRRRDDRRPRDDDRRRDEYSDRRPRDDDRRRDDRRPRDDDRRRDEYSDRRPRDDDRRRDDRRPRDDDRRRDDYGDRRSRDDDRRRDDRRPRDDYGDRRSRDDDRRRDDRRPRDDDRRRDDRSHYDDRPRGRGRDDYGRHRH